MKKQITEFLKENWFKIIIIAFVALIGFSIFYFLVIFLPQKEHSDLEKINQEQSLTNSVKCRELADKRSYLEGEHCYECLFNKEFNSCFCLCTYFSGEGIEFSRRLSIKDIIQNKDIIFSVYKRGGLAFPDFRVVEGASAEEFNAMYKKIFGRDYR